MNLITTKQAATILGISYRTLESMRLKGTGPAYSNVGRLVRYSTETLEEWVLSNQRRSTSDQNEAAAHVRR